MLLELGENWKSQIKGQFTQFSSPSNDDEKWSKNNDDLMHPDRVIATQISKKVLTITEPFFFNFTLH